jgi:hypothetical protein
MWWEQALLSLHRWLHWITVRSRKSAFGIFIKFDGRQSRSSGLTKKYPFIGFIAEM